MNSDTRFKKSALRSDLMHNRTCVPSKKKALALGIALALNVGAVQAAQNACYSFTAATKSNFTMLTANGTGATGYNPNYNSLATNNDPNKNPYILGGAGYAFGGTNNVLFTWDGTLFNSSTDYTGPGGASNATISSTTPFFSQAWTAHDVQLFGPGTYSFNSATGGGATESGTVTMTIAAGQIGAHMLFDWGGNNNIDVVNVWNTNTVFSSCGSSSGTPVASLGVFASNCLWTGAANPAPSNTASTVFLFASTDNDGDGTIGIPMAPGGPFGGFNANFNLKGSYTPVANDPCAPTVNVFSFTPVTNAPLNTVISSPNTITVGGIGAGTANITISGSNGEYSINGGSFTSAAGTVQDTNTVRVRQTSANATDTTTSTNLTIGSVSGTFNVTTPDTIPNSFSFVDQSGIAPGTQNVESNTITVLGIDTGVTIAISIAGGEYSKNGGAYTNAVGTVQLNDTVKVRQNAAATGGTTSNTTLTIGGVSDIFSITTSGGLSSTTSNFTMLDPSGGVTGGTNNVVATWDGSSTTNVNSNDFSHISLGSTTPFFGFNWTAHHIRVFGPSVIPYVINVDCTTAQLENGTCTPNMVDPTKNYTFTVGANQFAAHMLFDWNTTQNIDVVDIWNQSATFGPSSMFTGASGCGNPAQVWDYMSSDWDGDGQNGAAMIDGPFKNFKANFNLRFTQTALACSAYTPTVKVSDPSNTAGCSISSRPSNGIERGDWWLVAGFLAWLGGIQIRLKRKTQS
jgi:hypothetical protein